MTPRNEQSATLRDIMDLQNKMFDEMKSVRREVANVKIKIAVISSSVSLIMSVLFHLFKLQ